MNPPPLVLVIDDEPDIRALMVRMLATAGYEVLLAESGRAGIHLFAERLPTVVITDLLMPESDGLETIQAIRRIKADAKILLISGGGSFGSVALGNLLTMARELGADEVLEKPFGRDALLEKVTILARGCGSVTKTEGC
jgi:DNA-binding response OmpR family regulator